jgi:hypothetical protein
VAAPGVPSEIFASGPAPVPLAYIVAPGQVIEPASVFATFDGTSAAGAFLPCVTIRSQNGDVLSRTFPQGVVLNPGDVADVTFAPFLDRGGSGGGGGATADATYSDPLGVSVPGTTSTALPWVFGAGAALLDLTVPAAPTFIAAGTYDVSATVVVSPLGGEVAGRGMLATLLAFTPDGIVAPQQWGTWPTGGFAAVAMSPSAPMIVLAGGGISASFMHGQPGPLKCQLGAVVVKLA